MKHKIISALTAFAFIGLSGCGSSEMQLSGKIHSYDYLGYKCWFITDRESNFNYEIVTPDDLLLKEGMDVHLTAQKTDDETICKIGERVKVITYRLK